MSDGIAISVKNISKTYKARSKFPTHALKDLSADIKQGEITGLIGPNGAGKTTLMKIILGFLKADSGDVKIYDDFPDAISVRKRTAYQADLQYISKTIKVESYLKLHANLCGIKNPTDNIRYLLESFHMTSSANKSLHSLSRGMRQKIEIVQAFIGSPELVLFDEPTAFLDPPSVFELRDFLMNKKSSGITVLFSSHNLTEVEKICDRVLFINEGVLSGDYRMESYETGFLEDSFRKFRDERLEL
jgi:ABC-2 type transport system ATP-binding protein